VPVKHSPQSGGKPWSSGILAVSVQEACVVGSARLNDVTLRAVWVHLQGSMHLPSTHLQLLPPLRRHFRSRLHGCPAQASALAAAVEVSTGET
jgi:hypothetical protein